MRTLINHLSIHPFIHSISANREDAQRNNEVERNDQQGGLVLDMYTYGGWVIFYVHCSHVMSYSNTFVISYL